MVDSKVTFLLPTLMPSRPAEAFVKTNGEVWHQVIRSLPEWSFKECERLSRLLLREHRSFLNHFVRALLDESVSAFQQPPSNFPLAVSPGEAFSFDPPYADIDTSEFQRIYGGLEHHRIVRLEYERDRYMQHLSLTG